MKKAEALATIGYEFARVEACYRVNAFVEIDCEIINEAFHALGFDDFELSYGAFTNPMEFMAALEYFGVPNLLLSRRLIHAVHDSADALAKAVHCYLRQKYQFFEDVFDVDELGREVLFDEIALKPTNVQQVIIDNVNTEALGTEFVSETKGKFTHFGYFAPID